MAQKQRRIPVNRANLVGVIHSAAGFSAAKKQVLDAVEVRVDTLPVPPDPQQVADLPHPAIITVRRFDEGGSRSLADATRIALYHEMLPAAAAIDIEVRSLRVMQDLIDTARKAKRLVITSFHDFEGTPTLARLREIASRARDAGADVVKIATQTDRAGDVARLLDLLEKSPSPIAVMGMGLLGRPSRLLFAKAGSVLNYGWLASPQVSGQWSATELRNLLKKA